MSHPNVVSPVARPTVSTAFSQHFHCSSTNSRTSGSNETTAFGFRARGRADPWNGSADEEAHDDERRREKFMTEPSVLQSVPHDLTASTSSTNNESVTAQDPFGDMCRATSQRVEPPRDTVADVKGTAAFSMRSHASPCLVPVDLINSTKRAQNKDQWTNSRTMLVNVLAYWLSLQCERRSPAAALSTVSASNPIDSGYTPAYLKNASALRQRLEDIYWSTGGVAHNPTRALAALAAVRDDAPARQLQRALLEFVNAIGAEPLAGYMRRQRAWPELARRYVAVLGGGAATPGHMLQCMSEAVHL